MTLNMVFKPIKIIYLHGFQSSSRSEKCVSLQSYFDNLPQQDSCDFDLQIISPDLPFSATETVVIVETLISKLAKQFQVVLMGSSMGGFYASYFSQKHHLPAVLINPAVDANELFRPLLGKKLINSYTEEEYRVVEADLACLKALFEYPINRYDLIFNCLETADEVLDFRLSEKKYKLCQQKIIQGGNHRFQNFENCLPDMLQFYARCLKA